MTQGEPLRLVLQIAIVMLVAAALKAVLQFFGRQAFIGISRDVEYDLRNDFFRHLLTLSPDFYRRTRVGELLAVIAGAPNYFRGGSHCRNLSCREAMAKGLVDILCSDFHFPSMLGSVVMMMREGMEPSAAVNMVTLNAARHLRRDTHLGSIEVGKKADLVAFSPRAALPL